MNTIETFNIRDILFSQSMPNLQTFIYCKQMLLYSSTFLSWQSLFRLEPGKPRKLYLQARRYICPAEEIRWDYGVRDKSLKWTHQRMPVPCLTEVCSTCNHCTGVLETHFSLLKVGLTASWSKYLKFLSSKLKKLSYLLSHMKFYKKLDEWQNEILDHCIC